MAAEGAAAPDTPAEDKPFITAKLKIIVGFLLSEDFLFHRSKRWLFFAKDYKKPACGKVLSARGF